MNVKTFLAGRKGICPKCGIRVDIPRQSMAGAADGSDGEGIDLNAPQISQPNPMAEAVSALGPATENAPGAAAARQNVANPATKAQRPLKQPVHPNNIAHTVTRNSEFVLSAPEDESPLQLQSEVLQARPATAQGANVIPTPAAPLASDSSDSQWLPPGTELQLANQAPPTNSWHSNSPAPLELVQWYVYLPTGTQLGPVSEEAVHVAVQRRQIDADSLIWQEGWPEWQRISLVFPQLFGSRRRGSVPPAPDTINSAATTDHLVVEALAGEAPVPATMVRGRRQVRRETRARVSLILFVLTILLATLMVFILLKGHAQKNDSDSAAKKLSSCLPVQCDLAMDC